MASEVGFEELRVERQALNDAVAGHHASVQAFKHPEHPWFRLAKAEPLTDDRIRHLSSTATCLESLQDVPSFFASPGTKPALRQQADAALTAEFATNALEAPADRWQSDRAARIYCRVRTLAPILRLTPVEQLAPYAAMIQAHIGYVWERLDPLTPKFQGITEEPEQEDPNKPEPATYPPNAFHTFWAIRLLEEYDRHAEVLGPLDPEFDRKRAVAELWSRQTLSAQTALIKGKAEAVDAHQLAWALSLEFRQTILQPVTAASPMMELFRTALTAFFSAQLGSGNWPLYKPLFHYPAAGNAYCYTFETLTELLRPALHKTRGAAVRQLLRPHLTGLLDAWHFAERTAIPTDDRTWGWCSGHHPHRTDPEAWATAEVFSFLQVLRRLVGQWASEEAAESLGARPPRVRTASDAAKVLRQRGDTWTQQNQWTLGRRLAALFLHPLQALLIEQDEIDPDRPLIEAGDDQQQARSAILFGPPGASKTTLVEALAGAVGWRYIELHAADFLSGGMDRVPAQADDIFAKLMELDRCVVLFDEIDELIRERQGTESDPFGRFLTTSMLPKLAKLWEQRRILYFIATNDIDAADPAIKRSQRFDAALFAAPPSFAVKRGYLERELGFVPASLTYKKVSEALGSDWELAHALGVFALLRYDQVPELAERLRPYVDDGAVSEDKVRSELFGMGEGLQGLEWRDRLSAEEANPRTPYQMYEHFRKAERRDARMYQLLTIDPGPSTAPAGLAEFHGEGARYYEIVNPLETLATTVEHGRWQIEVGKDSTIEDRGLLDFRDEHNMGAPSVGSPQAVSLDVPQGETDVKGRDGRIEVDGSKPGHGEARPRTTGVSGDNEISNADE